MVEEFRHIEDSEWEKGNAKNKAAKEEKAKREERLKWTAVPELEEEKILALAENKLDGLIQTPKNPNDKYEKEWSKGSELPQDALAKYPAGDAFRFIPKAPRGNLRDEKTGGILGQLPKGDTVHIAGPFTKGWKSGKKLFIRVRSHNGNIGYAAGDFLKKIEEKPVVEKPVESFENPFKTEQARNLPNFLQDNPEMLKEYKKFRSKVEQSLSDFAGRCGGTSLENFSARLLADFRSNFDFSIMNLLKFTGQNADPQLMLAILKRNPPIIKLKKLDAQNDRNFGLTYTNKTPPLVVLHNNAADYGGYENFKSVVTHEFAHALVESLSGESYRRNPDLNEGITEMLAQKAAGTKSTRYKPEAELASLLYRLSPKATLAWYGGGSDAMYETALREALGKYVPAEEAAKLAKQAVYLDELHVENAGKLAEVLVSDKNSTKYASVRQLTYNLIKGRINAENWGRKVEKLRGPLVFGSQEEQLKYQTVVNDILLFNTPAAQLTTSLRRLTNLSV